MFIVPVVFYNYCSALCYVVFDTKPYMFLARPSDDIIEALPVHVIEALLFCSGFMFSCFLAGCYVALLFVASVCFKPCMFGLIPRSHTLGWVERTHNPLLMMFSRPFLPEGLRSIAHVSSCG